MGWNGNEEAMREHLEALRNHPPRMKPKKKKHKKKSWVYCIKCVIRVRDKSLFICPRCGTELREGSPRTVAGVLTRKRGGKKRCKSLGNQYADYLASAEWKLIRSRVLDRDGHECQGCDMRAVVVHHMSYDNKTLAGDNDSMLVSLCNGCHQEIEFDIINGVPVKNGLARANQKLFDKMASKKMSRIGA